MLVRRACSTDERISIPYSESATTGVFRNVTSIVLYCDHEFLAFPAPTMRE